MFGKMSGRIAAWSVTFVVVSTLAGCDAVSFMDPDEQDGFAQNGGGDGQNGSGGDAGAASDDIYYVAVDGDDQAEGLTSDTAFATLAHAGSLALPGDTIVMLPGVHSPQVVLEDFGGVAATITFRGEGDGVVLDGNGSSDVGIWCERCTNVTIEHLVVRNFTDVGILFTESTGVTLNSLEIHDNGFAAASDWAEGYGLHVEHSTDVLIHDNDVYRNGPSPQVLGHWMGTGINTFGNTDVVIRDNFSHGNVGGGMLVEDSVNVLVENNLITGNQLDATVEEWWDGALWVDGGHDVTVRGNTLTGNLGPALQISDEDNQQPHGYVLEDNIVTDNYFGVYLWNFGTEDLPPDNIVTLSGNDISSNTRQDIWIEAKPCPPEDPCI